MCLWSCEGTTASTAARERFTLDTPIDPVTFDLLAEVSPTCTGGARPVAGLAGVVLGVQVEAQTAARLAPVSLQTGAKGERERR